jgi:hypothetical protein
MLLVFIKTSCSSSELPPPPPLPPLPNSVDDMFNEWVSKRENKLCFCFCWLLVDVESLAAETEAVGDRSNLFMKLLNERALDAAAAAMESVSELVFSLLAGSLSLWEELLETVAVAFFFDSLLNLL